MNACMRIDANDKQLYLQLEDLGLQVLQFIRHDNRIME